MSDFEVESGFYDGKASIAQYDQLHAEALERLRHADGFFLTVLEGNRLSHISGMASSAGSPDIASLLRRVAQEVERLRRLTD